MNGLKHEIWLPVRFWEVSGLGLYGTANTHYDASRGDEFEVSNPEISAKLKAIEFKPTMWNMITDYSGHLNFPDQPVY